YDYLLFSMHPPPPRATLFPYTTLFRSRLCPRVAEAEGDDPLAVGRDRRFGELDVVVSVRVEQPAVDRAEALVGAAGRDVVQLPRSEEHTSELQSRGHLVCRLLLEKKKV